MNTAIKAQQTKIDKLQRDLEYQQTILKGMELALTNKQPSIKSSQKRVLISSLWRNIFESLRKSRFTLYDIERYAKNKDVTVYDVSERLTTFVRVGYLKFDKDEYTFTKRFYNKFSWAISLRRESNSSEMKQISFRKTSKVA